VKTYEELVDKYKYHCNACYSNPLGTDGCWTNSRSDKFSCDEDTWKGQKPEWKTIKKEN
jgi:hypothetical protein